MASENKVSRRGFLKTTGMAVVGGGMIPDGAAGGAGRGEDTEEISVREYCTLGRTGFQVSDISFGTGNLTNSNVLAVALDMGMNCIDTAEHYVNGQAERTVGEVIHMTPRAEEVAHEPYHEAIAELKAEGKVRFTGLSNHGMQHSMFGRIEDPMENVIGAAVEDGRFDVALFVYNFLQKEQGERIIDMCRTKNMGVTLMKTDPVGIGAILTDRMEEQRRSGRRISEAQERIVREYEAWVEAADEFKARHGLQSNTQVRDAATKFCLDNPGVHAVCPTINTFDVLEAFVSLSGQRLASTEDSMLASYDELLGRY